MSWLNNSAHLAEFHTAKYAGIKKGVLIMDDNMTMDAAEECNCEGCAAHMEGDQKGECTCKDKAMCKCEMCGNAPAEEEAPVAA